MIKKMTDNLGCWQRLLQLTRGNINIEKSQWSLLSWSYEGRWRKPKLNSNENSRGELRLNSPIDSQKMKEQLHRLEPSDADRVLGVGLTMDGTMTVELDYRMKQMRSFANKLKNAPLSCQCV